MTTEEKKPSPTEILAELQCAQIPSTPPIAEMESTEEVLDGLDLDFLSNTSNDEKSDASNDDHELTDDDDLQEETEEIDPEELMKSLTKSLNLDTEDSEAEEEEVSDDTEPPQGPSKLSQLFNRVNTLLDGSSEFENEDFRPKEPDTLEQTSLTLEEVERLILKYLHSKGSDSGRSICSLIKLPFHMIDPILKQLKQEQLVMFKGTAEMGDYIFAITETGKERARRYSNECSFFGSAPVSIADYLEAMELQSISKQEATEQELREAFSDLVLSHEMLEKLGPAINSGRGMFLYGDPGNGKTSIAERITQAFGTTIWIPRVLGMDGDLIRLYDPGIHQLVEEPSYEGIFDLSGVDARWVKIMRPTVVAGGELTMDELEVTQNPQTKICEAPLQLKSNCGTLVIDDFGRQTMPVDVLLNRWIVPLEKRYDFLNLPSGKKVQVPFDQLIIFSTNLEPKDLVDDAFLRRIPYKIHVPDPTEEQFRELFEIMSPKMGFELDWKSVEYLIKKHYLEAGRPFRACHPRDLLLQVRNFCIYKRQAKYMSPAGFDFAVDNYFSVM